MLVVGKRAVAVLAAHSTPRGLSNCLGMGDRGWLWNVALVGINACKQEAVLDHSGFSSADQ